MADSPWYIRPPLSRPKGPSTSAARRASGRTTARDRSIDTWRAAALVRVVLYHTLGWAWLTILFPAMGLMFALAGALMARSIDRRGIRVVGDRMRRLLPPLWAFAAVALVVMFRAGWRERPASPLGWGELVWWIVPVRTPPAGGPEWAWAFTSMLWYLVAYLWLVVLSPALLRVFRRWPVPVLVGSLLLPAALEFRFIVIDGYLAEPLENICVYLGCWLLGFAHHDGLIRSWSGKVFALLVGGMALVSLGWLVRVGLGQNDFDLNHVPLAKGLWPATFVAVVLRFGLPIGALRDIGWVRWLVDVINARAVTVYLWHFSALIAAQHALGQWQRPYSPHQSVILLAGVVGSTVVATVLVGWVEDLAARRPAQLVPGLPLGSRRARS